jgi:hypothetical protein
MIVVQLTGGLGNQLFQYAAAKALSWHHDATFMLDTSSFLRTELPELEVPRNFELNIFPAINEQIITVEELRKLFDTNKKKIFYNKLIPPYKQSIYNEPHFHFDKNFFKSKKKVLLIGNWQSEKYFSSFKKQLRSILVINNELVKNVISEAENLQKTESIGIHIRRGDYLRKQIIFEWHGVMNKGYYLKGLEIISKKITPGRILFFTDDPEWVEKELLPITGGEIASNNISKTHVEDLYLMSQCRHNIIANSSFSWWGAWLNSNTEKIVVAPERWFGNGPKDTQDIIPTEWIKI